MHPRLLLALILCTAAALLLPGCSSMEPPYPQAVLTHDAGLAGTWEFQPPEGRAAGRESGEAKTIRVTIGEREVAINDGRLDPGQAGPDGKLKGEAKAQARAKGYLIDFTDGGPGVPLLGVTFTTGKRTLLGVQVAASRLLETGLANWVLPLHQVYQVERTGDELRIRGLVVRLGWVPGVEFVDAGKPGAGGGAGPDTLRTFITEKAGAHITTDIDRLITLYREGDGDDRVWEDQWLVLKRLNP